MLGTDRGQRRQGLGEEGVGRGATQDHLILSKDAVSTRRKWAEAARVLLRQRGCRESPGRSRVAPKGQEGLQPRRCPGLPLPPASGAAPVLTVVCGHVWSQNHKEGR